MPQKSRCRLVRDPQEWSVLGKSIWSIILSVCIFLLYHFELDRVPSCLSFSAFLVELMPVPKRRPLGRSCERSGTAVVSSTRTLVMQFGNSTMAPPKMDGQRFHFQPSWWLRLALYSPFSSFLLAGTEMRWVGCPPKRCGRMLQCAAG